MATLSTGSPKLTKRTSANFVVLDQGSIEEESQNLTAPTAPPGVPNPLQTDKFANTARSASMANKFNMNQESGPEHSADIATILARIAENDNKGRERENILKQAKAIDDTDGHRGGMSNSLKRESQSSAKSDPYTTSTGPYHVVQPDSDAEMMRVKQELAAAKNLITRQEQELAKSRVIKPVDNAQNLARGAGIDSLMQTHDTFAVGPTIPQVPVWQNRKYPEEARSDGSDGLPVNLNRTGGIWSANQPNFGSIGQVSMGNDMMGTRSSSAWAVSMGLPNAQNSLANNQRVLSGPSMPTHGFESRFSEEPPQFNLGAPRRMSSQITRPTTNYNMGMANAEFGRGVNPYGGNAFGGMAPAPINTFGFGNQLAQPRPIGTPLSPTALEFNGNALAAADRPFSAMSNVSSTYYSPVEPMNYRSLLDKTVNCDWKYIVDKIVCSNDQQASIFLQQKLKVGNAEQKYEIIEAIVQQAYALMINRFGNFLVQRCFEHGTPEQVVKISHAIRGNVLPLSTDAFGCHVIQKAFDSVPETHKADMVRELLRRIPDTVIHRYACHVWQKLFELRWSGEPPQIMVKVNEALRGMWHEVALGETGSLVVQNIFENCVEEEKRPAINEVIAKIDLIAHGQFGNWCIQHLCEHGAPADKRRVIDHILSQAHNYSVDQFASKVVEKCLKIGGAEFMDQYLEKVTAAYPDRPRIPLIDISGDQYGNYLVQWILMNSHHHQREQVAGHIRKHMVSLRGSKFGSRVAMLCCNPASVTRPGPGVIINPFGVPGQPRSGAWGRFR